MLMILIPPLLVLSCCALALWMVHRENVRHRKVMERLDAMRGKYPWSKPAPEGEGRKDKL